MDVDFRHTELPGEPAEFQKSKATHTPDGGMHAHLRLCRTALPPRTQPPLRGETGEDKGNSYLPSNLTEVQGGLLTMTPQETEDNLRKGHFIVRNKRAFETNQRTCQTCHFLNTSIIPRILLRQIFS